MIYPYSKYPNFQRANLQGVNFKDEYSPRYDADELEERVILIFQRAKCQRANFQGVNLHRAEFQGAKCERANFQEVNLHSAKFQGADLKNANLKSAVLRGAEFQGADLSGAKLQFADLHEANFQGAVLHAANLEGCTDYLHIEGFWNPWKGATYDSKTKFPVGFDPHKYGLVKTPNGEQVDTMNTVGNSTKNPNKQNETDRQIKNISITIQKRQGQAKFREQLLKYYRGRCAITGCDITGVLEAAHIKPYSMSQKETKPENGILLRADLHTLFDLNLIVIHPQSKRIEIKHPLLHNSEYQEFNDIVLPSYTKFNVCPDDDYLKWRYDSYGEYIEKYIRKLL